MMFGQKSLPSNKLSGPSVDNQFCGSRRVLFSEQRGRNGSQPVELLSILNSSSGWMGAAFVQTSLNQTTLNQWSVASAAFI